MISLSLGQRLQQEIRLTLEQRQRIEARMLTLRLELIEALREDHYEPKGVCPRCGRTLTPEEIIRGFNQDPLDFTTSCSGCGKRFEPKIINRRANSSVELSFFCDAQTLKMMRGLEIIEPKQFQKKFPAIYHSAIVHFGSIGRAMKEIDRIYPFDESLDWKEKVVPFLGVMPDTLIARFANAKVSAIRVLRKKYGVGKFRSRDALNS